MGLKEQVKAIIVKNPAIAINADEYCVFQTKCQFGQQVLKTTTTSKPGVGVGVGIPVTKHFGIGIGKTKVKTTTTNEVVWDKKNCVIVLTTQRFLFKVDNTVYTLDLNTFQDIKINKDAITIISGGVTYYFLMKNADVQRFLNTWSLIGEAARQGLVFDEL